MPASRTFFFTVHCPHLFRPNDFTVTAFRGSVARTRAQNNSAVPIYDSVASGFLRGLVPLRRIRDFQIPVPDCADPEYADYVRRFAHLYQTIASHALPVTVRSLDSYLISSS